jgi:2-iminobutanoate/2-iminopropanoate deaminase
MNLISINSSQAPQVPTAYSQAMEVRGAQRLLFISGQVGESASGEIPKDIGSQLKLAWDNLFSQLAAADMTVANLVKVTVLLSSRNDLTAFRAARKEAMQDHVPALTVIIADTVDARWLVEIEGIAVA